MSVNYRMDKYIMVDSYNGLSCRIEYEWTVPAHLELPGDSVVKNLQANAGDARDMGSTLGQEDSLEEEMATHSSILAWKIP